MAKVKVEQEDDAEVKSSPHAPYRMPPVEIGDVVFWHDSQEAPYTSMALVTAVGNDNVCLAVLAPGYNNFYPLEGVRHRRHPDRQIVAAAAVGVWSHRPITRAIHALLEERVRAGDVKPNASSSA